MRYFVILSLFVGGIRAAAEDWWNPAWQYRQRIHLNSSIIQEDLLDFPLGLRFTDAQFARTRAHEQGRDLRAVDEEGNLLPIEIVRWQPSRIELYVSVPHIAAGTPGQYVDLYYGHAGELESAPVASAPVWDDSYRAVLHLDRGVDDARGLADVARIEGAVELDDSAVFEAQGPGYIALAPDVLDGIGDAITVCVRFLMRENPGLQTLVSGLRPGGPEEWFNFGLKVPNTVHTNATSRGRRAPELNPQGIAPGQWHSAIVVYDARQHTRTICIDGLVLERDQQLPGPLEVSEVRIGRGVLHFDPWQFHGALDEVRLAGVARSDSWIRAEAACLGERNPFVAVGPPQAFGDPHPAPAPFDLVRPPDGTVSRRRAGTVVEWLPSAGAESYAVMVCREPDMAGPLETIDAQSSTSAVLPRGLSRGGPVYWTVLAGSKYGETRSNETRRLSFYDWSDTMTSSPKDSAVPALAPAHEARFDLEGYLRSRIDRTIRRYYMAVPETSPAILQVLRDRDKSPIRDPLVPWAGEFAGKYLTGAQLAWRLTRDEGLKEVINRFVKDLIACQVPPEDERWGGYLGPFPESSRLTGGNWDVWGHYHCMLGLMLYYEDTQYAPALDACRNAADLLFETFGPGGPSLTCDGSGGEMNMAVCHALVLLYRKTGVERYLELANYIVHDAWNEEGAGHYLECALDGQPVVSFPRHRWESLHDWQALAEMYWLTGKDEYRAAFEHIWRDGVRGDRHNTGGATSGEGFQGTPYHDGAIETCCTVAWIAYSIDMLRMTGDTRIADEIEWSTLNSALGAVPYGGRACTYNVPMDGTRTFGVELPWQSPKAGPDLNCCAVNANRPLGMMAQWGLMQSDPSPDHDRVGQPSSRLVLNYYGPGSVATRLPSGVPVTLRQDTDYPLEGRVSIVVTPESPETFEIAFRIPRWSRETAVQVNGEAFGTPVPGTYLGISREWQAGDEIVLELDFSIRVWAGEEAFAGKASVYRGPLLFAYDARYNELDPHELPTLDCASLSLERVPWEGPIEPWALARLSDGAGAGYLVCDFSSAGQTGNHYVSWLPMINTPPSPFSLVSPPAGSSASPGDIALAWEKHAVATHCVVLVGDSPDMARSRRAAQVTESKAAVSLAPGRWFWSVVAVNDHGETEAVNGPWRLDVE